MNSVEKHPQRQQIIDDIISGKPLVQIAAKLDPPLHFATISRYRTKVLGVATRKMHGKSATTKALKEFGQAVASEDGENDVKKALRDELQMSCKRLNERRERWIQDAERVAVYDDSGAAVGSKMDHRALSSYDRNDLSSIELQAKLAGILQETANHVQIVASMQIGSDGQVAGEVIDIAETR